LKLSNGAARNERGGEHTIRPLPAWPVPARSVGPAAKADRPLWKVRNSPALQRVGRITPHLLRQGWGGSAAVPNRARAGGDEALSARYKLPVANVFHAGEMAIFTP